MDKDKLLDYIKNIDIEFTEEQKQFIAKTIPFLEEGNKNFELQSDFTSLCLLSYNRPNYLVDTLDSIQSSSKKKFELIVHDDGSFNELNRETLMTEVALKDSAIVSKVILNHKGHNEGQGVALNRMFEMAKGDPIVKVDSDILFYSGWDTEVERLFETHPEIGLLGLMHYYHDPVDSKKTVIDRRDDHSVHTHILGSAFAVRRQCWEELKPFEEYSPNFGEDWDFQKRVTASPNWVCALPKEDLAKNMGMGVGKSTIVLDNDGTVETINKKPWIYDPNKEIE